MSDQPSEAPTPVLLLIAFVALVALTGSLFIGISTELGATSETHAAAAPAPAPTAPAPTPAPAAPATPEQAAPATPAPTLPVQPTPGGG